jgi:hypothetical protein
VVVARVLGRPWFALSATEVAATTETATTEVTTCDYATDSDEGLKQIYI